MKKPYLKICISVFAFCLSFIFIIIGNNFENESAEELEEESHAFDAFEWWYNQRVSPHDLLPSRALYNAQIQANRLMKKEAFSTISADDNWQSIGPNNVGGRVLSLAMNPLDTSILWAGSASGGLWKSTTRGKGANAWTYITTGFPAISISAIAIDNPDTNNIYIGTGEISYYHYPLIGTPGARASYGMGILKSTDGGITWNTTSLSFQFSAITAIQKIIINPLNSNTVYAATSEGVYKSTDAGLNWNISNNIVMVMDLVINPIDTTVLYSSHGNLNSSPNPGIYKTTNAGISWVQLTTGLPTDNFGRTALSISPTNPNIIIAGISNASSRTIDGLYKSTDDGNSWAKVSNISYVGSQGWYNNVVAVSPVNPNIVYCSGMDFYRSLAGGASLVRLSNWSSYYLGYIQPGGIEGDTSQYVHADHHALLFNPLDPDDIFIGTDGGVFETTNGGNSFQGRNGGLVTTQFYGGFANYANSDNISIGGLQDNGVLKYSGSPSWSKIDEGDGGFNAIDPRAANVMYDEYVYLTISKSVNGGLSFSSISGSLPTSASNANFVAPFVISFSNPDILYAGAKAIYKTTTGGSTWFAPGTSNLNGTNIASIGVSWTNPDTLMVATGTGTYGTTPSFFVYVSKNGGNTWNNVTSSLPLRFASDIHFDPTNSKRVYLVYSGYGASHVFMSTNVGQTWNDISVGLPDVPVQSIINDPEEPSNIYIGTDLGIYKSTDFGSSWTDFNAGMPLTMITDLTISNTSGYLRATTFGNGIYQRLLHRTPSFALNTPLGGETFIGGTTTHITWTQKHCNGLNIEFSSDNGANWDIIADSVPAALQSFLWDIPTIETTEGKIRVIHLADGAPLDTSVNTFSIIVNPQVFADWNIVSLPYSVTDSTLAALFPTATSLAFTFDGRYKFQDYLNQGSGYWVKFSAPEHVIITGDSIVTDTINLHTGWNIIGSISSPVSVTNIIQTPSNIISSLIFGFKDGYTIADSIYPMKGYWLKANQSGIIILSSVIMSAKSKSTQFDELSNYNSILIEDAAGKKQILYVGETENNPTRNKFELPPLPPKNCFDIRYSNNTFVGFISENTASEEKLPININGAIFPLKVSVSFKGNIDMTLSSQEEIFPLNNNVHFSITKPTEQLLLTAKKNSSIQIPKSAELFQNYPNPFNPTTVIRFRLDNKENTKLTLYNSLGKEVSVLVNEMKEPGDYSVNWNPEGLPTGVYFYTLDIGTKSFTKKLLLLK